ncbi:MAG: glycoside hydrolase family 30 beta sandwich domain-containing protein [Clostridiaceae bacterium]
MRKKLEMFKFSIVSIISVITFVTIFTSCSNQLSQYIEVYETTGTKSKLLTRQTDLEFKDINNDSDNAIFMIDEKAKEQEIEGFGVAITHSSAYVLMQIDKERREQILKDLFSKEDGAGFELIRLPIGASDYAGMVDGELKHFTLDDVASGDNDVDLEKFNIDVDLETIIPVVKEILEINPNVKIVSTPWSAPAWMKNTNSLYGGSLLEENEDVYTEYLIKYLKMYKEQGISIKYLTLQNEPMLGNSNYPVMLMGEYQQLSLVKKLGKKFASSGFKDTKILAYDFNYSEKIGDITKDFIDTVLGDKTAQKYVEGVAFHGYENDGLEDFVPGFSYVNDKYNKMSLVTEMTEGKWSVDFANNLSYSLTNVVLGPLNYYSAGTIYWNAVLYEDGSPVLGGGENSLGVISVADDGVNEKGAAYYAMAHISKFINCQNGKAPVRLVSECESPNIIAVAIKRGDGKIVTVLHNTSSRFPESVDIQYKNKSFTYEIQPQSVVTFIW